MDNDTLIVSEKDQKAYLPYKYSDLEKFYSENKDKYGGYIIASSDSYKDRIERRSH